MNTFYRHSLNINKNIITLPESMKSVECTNFKLHLITNLEYPIQDIKYLGNIWFSGYFYGFTVLTFDYSENGKNYTFSKQLSNSKMLTVVPGKSFNLVTPLGKWSGSLEIKFEIDNFYTDVVDEVSTLDIINSEVHMQSYYVALSETSGFNLLFTSNTSNYWFDEEGNCVDFTALSNELLYNTFAIQAGGNNLNYIIADHDNLQFVSNSVVDGQFVNNFNTTIICRNVPLVITNKWMKGYEIAKEGE